MAEGTLEADSWRRIRLVNEPIYYAAPLPSNPDDIICPGSYDETNKTIRTAKILRYENQARCYLEGKPIHIFSASLRGPFDKASGWQNPWLPKSPIQTEECLINTYRTSNTSVAVRDKQNMKVSGKLSSKIPKRIEGQDDSMADSMDCHLPSPQSHQDLQIFDSPSRTQKHFRIESWAEQVQGGPLEKDEFWAPDHASEECNNESPKKRPAGKDWLKRRPAKRKRFDASQDTAATSTPTPLPAAQPITKRGKKSTTAKRLANQSFEMTTPSSNTDQGTSESLDPVNPLQLVSHSKDGQPTASNMSIFDSRVSPGPPLEVRIEEEDEGDPGAMENMSQSQQQGERSHSNKETNDLPKFLPCADDSFCYQVRPTKQVTSLAVPKAPSVATSSPLSQLTQIDTPASSRNHDDEDMVPSHPDTNSETVSEVSDANNAQAAAQRASNLVTATTIANGAVEPLVSVPIPVQNQRTWEEVVLQKCDNAKSFAEGSTTSAADNTRRPLRDITSNTYLSISNILNTMPQTLLEPKGQVVSSEPLFDDGSTLVDDPMEMDQPGNNLPTQEKSGDQLCISSLVETETDKIGQSGDLTTISEGVEGGGLVAAKSRPGITGSQPNINKPTSQSSQGEVAQSAIEVDEDVSLFWDGRQIVSSKPQSPWASTTTVIKGDKTVGLGPEQVKDRVKHFSVLPISMLINSPVQLDKSPMIRPSQQSPWVQEVIEPVIVRRGVVNVNTLVHTEIESLRESQTPLLPEKQGHALWASSSPAVQPVSGISSQVPSGYEAPDKNIKKEEGDISSRQTILCTPRISRQSTPEVDLTIKSFSNFNNTLSPEQSRYLPSSFTKGGILSSRKYTSTGTTVRLGRRVRFAPLPHEHDHDGTLLSSVKPTRAASPPPPNIVDINEENVDGKYRNHFDVMNRRICINGPPKLQYQRRLLPSSSQQIPGSPSVEAMAEAFKEADVCQSSRAECIMEIDEVDKDKAGADDMEDKPQSPWRQESQVVDDVADVIRNLDQFLDVWDVDTEIDKNRAELERKAAENNGMQSHNTDINIMYGQYGVGIW